jgi:hypothetical protein
VKGQYFLLVVHSVWSHIHTALSKFDISANLNEKSTLGISRVEPNGSKDFYRNGLPNEERLLEDKPTYICPRQNRQRSFSPDTIIGSASGTICRVGFCGG